MDTQRLILFAHLLVLRALPVGGVAEREHRRRRCPPSSVAATGAAKPRRPAAGAAPAAPPARRATRGARRTRRRPPRPAAGQIVTIKTDLFTAEIDTRRRRDHAGRARQAPRRRTTPPKPYLALQRNAERTFVAQAGLIGDGMPNHRTAYEVLPGPRELAPGADDARAEAAGDRRERRQGRADADVPSRQLRDRRRVRRHQCRHRADHARGVFPADARHQAGGAQNSMAPAAFVGPVVYNETDKFKKIDFGEIDKEAADPSRKPAYTKSDRQRLDRHDRALLRRRVAAARHGEAAAPVLHDEARQRPLHRGRALRRRADRARRAPARCTSRLYVGPQDQDVLAKLAQGPRPRRRLRHLHDHRRAAVLAAQVAARRSSATGAGRSS